MVSPGAGSPARTAGPSPARTAASSSLPTASPSSVADPLSTARIDGGDWEITHIVTTSDRPAFGIGDLTIRVYQNVRYQCSTPPCGVALKTDDPNTVDRPRAATFVWRSGSYVSTDLQRAIDRCDAPDGTVVPDAYDVVIQTTVRVAAVGDRNGSRLATKLVGDQSRHGTPTDAAASHGCPAWSVTFQTTGQRNIKPGLATTVRSHNWAGYVVSRDDARITRVQGSWIQPAIRCESPTAAYSSFWIGIDGVKNDSVEQIGTEADCLDGKPTYDAWWETFPDPETRIKLAVHPGDHMSASIRSTGDRYTMTLRNQTTDHEFSKTVDWPSADGSSAEWIAEATSLCPDDDCQIQLLPDFGAVRFTDAEAATKSSGLLGATDPRWGLERSVMITQGGRTKAEVSPLGVGGNTFTVTWRPL